MGRIWFIVWLLLIAALGYGVRLLHDPAAEGAIAQQSFALGLPILAVILAAVLLVRIVSAGANPLWFVLGLAWELALVPVAAALLLEADPLVPLTPLTMRIALVLLATLAAFLALVPRLTRAFRRRFHIRLLRLVAGLAALLSTAFLVPMVVAGAIAAFPFARIPAGAVEYTRVLESTGLVALEQYLPGQLAVVQMGLVIAYVVAGILLLADRLASRLPVRED